MQNYLIFNMFISCILIFVSISIGLVTKSIKPPYRAWLQAFGKTTTLGYVVLLTILTINQIKTDKPHNHIYLFSILFVIAVIGLLVSERAIANRKHSDKMISIYSYSSLLLVLCVLGYFYDIIN